MKPLLSLAICLLLIGCLLAAVWAGDKWLTKADRARLAHLEDDWLTVQDALLRHEATAGYLPLDLAGLVPHYLRADQLSNGERQRWRYDRENRQLALADPVTIRGLWTREVWVDRSLPPGKEKVAGVFSLTETAGRLLVPSGPVLPAPPEGVLIFQGEHYSDMTYGWEVHPDPESSGGAYIHSKEGIANGPAQIREKVYDFYNIRETAVYTSLTYHLRIPRAGHYYLSARMWTTGSHCSNAVRVGVDSVNPPAAPRPRHGHDYTGPPMRNSTPFRWVWTQAGKDAIALTAGDHYIHIFSHEDGIRLDQLALSPTPMTGETAYQANLWPNHQTAFAAEATSPLHLTFDLKSLILEPTCPTSGHLVLRQRRPASGTLMIDIYLDDAPTGRDDHRLQHDEVSLEQLPEVSFLPLALSGLDLAALPRREYLLRAEARLDGQLIASCHIPLLRPFAWEVSPVYDFLKVHQRGPLDPQTGDAPEAAWATFSCDNMDHFGVLDFGLHTTGNSLHADEWKTIYARTRILVPAESDYQFKLQSDDQMRLWIDGREVMRNEQTGPVTRSVARPVLPLAAGPHELLMRINQAGESRWQDGRWQASLRIRTPDDTLSDVIGLPDDEVKPQAIAR